MAKGNVSVVRGKLSSVTSQRQQYKPYGYELTFDDVEIEIIVPDEGVVVKSGGVTTLNLEGFKVVLEALANAVDEVHDAYVVKARKAGKY